MPEPAGEQAAAGSGRIFAGPESLAGVVRAAFGPGRRLAAVDRLRGGSKKGVYRLTLDDGATVIGYLWNAAENYWPAGRPETGESHAEPFSDASGADLFEASHAYLDGLGVRVPRSTCSTAAGRATRLTSRWSRTCPVRHWRRSWSAACPVRIRH